MMMALQPGQTCPEWQYTKTDPNFDSLLKTRAAEVSLRIRGASPTENESWCVDTRTVHRPYFRDLTPPSFDHYAGHYRGEGLDCLDHYEVGVPGDPVVGWPAATVTTGMNNFRGELLEALSVLDLLWKINPHVIGTSLRLQRTVEVATALLVLFMEIHPYADGNGHMGRFLLLGIFARYGLFPAKFPLHPRPAPPYVDLIPIYRQGNKIPLLQYILRSF
jgi:hypothetical protein